MWVQLTTAFTHGLIAAFGRPALQKTHPVNVGWFRSICDQRAKMWSFCETLIVNLQVALVVVQVVAGVKEVVVVGERVRFGAADSTLSCRTSSWPPDSRLSPAAARLLLGIGLPACLGPSLGNISCVAPAD